MAGPLALVWDLIATDNASGVFKKVGAEADSAAKGTGGMGSAFTKMGGAIAIAGVALTVVAVKMAMDFQASTAKIQGNAQISQKAAVAIGDAFLATAGKSTFSGKEMTDAFAPVSGVVQTLAGHALTAADSMTFMSAATTLAEATGQDLGVSTSSLAAVMQSYGIKLKDAADASNTLFNTSRLTGVGIDTLAGMVDKLHAKLGIASPTLADTSALIDDLANHGVSGSRGLMVVNTALTTLMGGSKATTTELKTLGIHVFDTSGKFVGMKGVLEQLTPKLKGMTQEQQLHAEKLLFGGVAAKALNSTLLAGVDGYAKATAAVTKHGAAETAAKAAADTMAGQLKILKASFSDVMVMIGEKVIPVIQKVVQWFEQHKEVTVALAAIVGGVMVVALVAMAVAWVAATWEIILAVAAIAAIAAGLIYCWNHFETFRTVVTDVFHAVEWIIGKAVQGIILYFKMMLDVWGAVIGGIINAAADVAEALHLPFAKGLRNVSNSFNDMKTKADKTLSGLANSAGKWGQQTGANFADGLGSQASAAQAQANKIAAAVAKGLAPGVSATVIGSLNKIAAGYTTGHNASGTDNWRGGLTWINERGPEIVNLPSGSQVIPADKSAAMMGGKDFDYDRLAEAVSRRQIKAVISVGSVDRALGGALR